MTRLLKELVKQVNSFKVPLSLMLSQLIHKRLSVRLVELKDACPSLLDGILLLNKTNA